jgi:hypothetical protein
MSRLLLSVAACAGCASAPPREPTCTVPAERVEILQIQLDRQREDLARDLLGRCRAGAAMEPLQDRYSEAPGGSVLVGRRSDVPFRTAALCLRKNECALIRSNFAFHVLKRID